MGEQLHHPAFLPSVKGCDVISPPNVLNEAHRSTKQLLGHAFRVQYTQSHPSSLSSTTITLSRLIGIFPASSGIDTAPTGRNHPHGLSSHDNSACIAPRLRVRTFPLQTLPYFRCIPPHLTPSLPPQCSNHLVMPPALLVRPEFHNWHPDASSPLSHRSDLSRSQSAASTRTARTEMMQQHLESQAQRVNMKDSMLVRARTSW
jgi:hypothetical protein